MNDVTLLVNDILHHDVMLRINVFAELKNSPHFLVNISKKLLHFLVNCAMIIDVAFRATNIFIFALGDTPFDIPP